MPGKMLILHRGGGIYQRLCRQVSGETGSLRPLSIFCIFFCATSGMLMLYRSDIYQRLCRHVCYLEQVHFDPFLIFCNLFLALSEKMLILHRGGGIHQRLFGQVCGETGSFRPLSIFSLYFFFVPCQGC